MKRKYFSVLLMGALAIASTSMVTSCKDYDDDINNLQSQIDQLNKIIEQIKSEITAGSVISKVENTSTGVDITLSNGQKYSITNGLNGKDGKDGVNGLDGAPGTAWTISEDGYWVKDGVKTEYKALGQDGKDGKDGLNGQDGKDGQDGLNGQDGKDGQDGQKGDKGDKGETGNYYKPNAKTGMFDLCDSKGNVIESTNIAWRGTGVTAVMDNDNLTLYNVADKNGVFDPNGVQIALSNNLRGFVFEKDNSGRVYVDGVPGIRVSSFSFYAQKLDKADSQNEKSVKADDKEEKDVVNPTTYAYYHVNPSNANVEDLKKLSFVVKANADYITTRGAASKNFDAKAEFVEFKDGVLKVKVDMTGEPATAEKISVVALQATKDNKETVTSDYATLYKQDMKELRLANKKKFEVEKEEDKVDYHFRRAVVGIDAVDNAAGTQAKAWSTQDGSDTDLDLQYDATIDLNDYVQAHENGTPCSVADLEALGFGIKYEVVKNYKIGTNNTDQADFVKLDGSELSAKVFKDVDKFAAVGRTPIIRASIYNKSNSHVVEYAYIKVNIVKKAVENKNIDLTIGNFAFDCAKNCELKSTVEQINVQLYNAMNMDRDEFHNTYTYFEANNVTGQVGTVKELKETIDGETTHLLQWTMTPDEMWANADKDVTHECYYKVAETSNRWVKITLKAHVNDIKKVYNLTSADFINEYWNTTKTFAKFNVATPVEGSVDATKCVFVNDLNSPFTTEEGKLKLDKNITNFTYSFCKDIEKVTKVGDITVKFAVVNNGTELKATVAGETQTVATINNAGAAVPFNTVTLNKESEIAKKLLNTGKFEAYYSVKANVCNDAAKEVKVTFNNEDHFAALFVRPVDITAKSADNFEDGVDFGEKGTYLKLEDLIAPSDWRGRAFKDYKNYWKYYGAFTITPDLENATCDLKNSENPDGSKHIAVPATIQLASVPAGTVGSGKNEMTSEYGFVSYKNNGTVVTSDFNIYVKVKVDYGWGTIVTGEIAVPVKKTKTAE